MNIIININLYTFFSSINKNFLISSTLEMLSKSSLEKFSYRFSRLKRQDAKSRKTFKIKRSVVCL